MFAGNYEVPAKSSPFLCSLLVTKNSILLVDYANQLRASGMPKEDAMRKAAPDKHLIPAPVEDGTGCEGCSECPYMKLNTLEKMYLALRDLEPAIEMAPDLLAAARRPLERMLELS